MTDMIDTSHYKNSAYGVNQMWHLKAVEEDNVREVQHSESA